jgi:hypothetical protein
MPIAHFSVSARRNTQPQSATDAVHYLTREGAWQQKGEQAEAAHDVAYLARHSKETKARNDFVDGDVRHLPRWAGESATTFFHEASQWERVGGRYAYVLQMSLPRSLTHDQQMALKDDFIEATLHDKSLLWVKHAPVALDGQPNPHLHIMFSARINDGIERDPQRTFARYNRASPEEGGCLKDRFWNEKGALTQMRMAYTDVSNFHLELAGVQERIDPRSLRDQGIDRPSFGKASRGHTLSRDVEAEQHKAAEAWEQRKAYKDISDVQAIPREEFVLLVRQWTRDYDRGQQLPRVSHAEVQTWTSREQTRLATEHAAVDHQLAQVERGLAGKLRAHELLALTRHQTQEEPVTPGLRARIFEDDHPGYRY